MNRKDIEDILIKACANIFERQPNIFDFTSQTGQTEWNLAHHYANEICHFIKDLDCDVDVTKHEYDDKRPDIIFHRRGGNTENRLVIEMKYNKGQTATENDIRKIHEVWFRPPLEYDFGAVVNIQNDKTFGVTVFENTDKNQS